MDNLSAAELWTALLAVASSVVLLSNAAEKIAKAWRTAKAPSQALSDRMDEWESWKEDVDRKLDTDKVRLDSMDRGNRVTQLALLALLDHGIDGNNIDQMQHAKEELQQHLINR